MSSKLPALCLMVLFSAACGGAVAEEAGGAPPPLNPRFELRVEGKRVGLGAASGTKFEVTQGDTRTSFISVGAEESPLTGDYIRSASVSLFEPFKRGSFNCTPSASGETLSSAGAALSPGPFVPFAATLRDCVVVVEYVSADRVVGRFSANAVAPVDSSLSGKGSPIEGEFDVELKTVAITGAR